jgi:Fe-S cluster assembly scaffold protein SufB
MGYDIPVARGGGDVEVDAPGNVLRDLGFKETGVVNYLLANATSSVVSKRIEREGGYLLGVRDALDDLPEVRRRAWRLIDPRRDRYTALVALNELEGAGEGYVLYLPRGVKIGFPIYACMVITQHGMKQLLHNIIVLEDGAEAVLVTGCGASMAAVNTLHAGITEVFVGRRAVLRYAMIHHWGSGSHVRPRTAVTVYDGGEYVSHYILHGGLASLHSESSVLLGVGARVFSASVVAVESGRLHVGVSADIRGGGASVEIVSRILAKGDAFIETPLHVTARAPGRGHIECMGIPLSSRARIVSQPILESMVDSAELTHEAAIGKLRGEEIEYLMARGLSEAEARRLLLQGILHVDAPGIPPSVKALIRATERILAEKGAL